MRIHIRRLLLVILASLLFASSSSTVMVRRTGTPLTDWCPTSASGTCISLWNMDQASAAIRVATGGTCDYAGDNCDLDIGYTAIEKDETYYKEGTGSADFDFSGLDNLACADADCDELDRDGAAVSYGGWFRVTYDTVSVNVLMNWSGGSYQYGYGITRNANQNDLRCRIGDGADSVVTNGTDDQWGTSLMYHVFCTADGTTIRPYFDGSHDSGADASQDYPALDAGDFTIAPYDGQADEVVVFTVKLEDAEVCRITRCGVHGEKCMCDGGTPANFKSCTVDADCRVAGNDEAICNSTTCSGRSYSCSLGSCNAAQPS